MSKQECKNHAIKIIERSIKTQNQVEEKLKDKGYSSEDISYAIAFLKEYNFINDSYYSKCYIRDKIKTQGKIKIKNSLLRKGVAPEIIEEQFCCTDDCNIAEAESEGAKKMALKKYKLIVKRETDKYKIKGKLLRFLIGRGYSYDLSYKTVDSIVKEGDDFEY